MAEILVRGAAEALLDPTSASMDVTVRVAGAVSQAEAVRRAAERCEAVDAVIGEHRGGLVTRAVHSSLRTGEEWEYVGQQRSSIGFYAMRTTQVESTPDGPGMTAMLSDIAEMTSVRVQGPTWHIAPDASGYDELRRDAAADARRKAQAYAVGLGMQVGPVLWIAEPGLRGKGGGGGGGDVAFASASPRAMRAASAGSADEEPAAVRITPEPIRVSASVEVAFGLAI